MDPRCSAITRESLTFVALSVQALINNDPTDIHVVPRSRQPLTEARERVNAAVEHLFQSAGLVEQITFKLWQELVIAARTSTPYSGPQSTPSARFSTCEAPEFAVEWRELLTCFGLTGLFHRMFISTLPRPLDDLSGGGVPD